MLDRSDFLQRARTGVGHVDMHAGNLYGVDGFPRLT